MLSEVEFHTGVADPVDYAARLLRKAWRSGVRVRVTAAPALLAQLDRLLWQEPERDFIPHLRWPGAPAAMAARTPIWLCADSAPVAPDADVGLPRAVVNVGAPAPPDSAALDRLIEIVGIEPEAAAGGRERWRAYKAAGLEIRHHPQR